MILVGPMGPDEAEEVSALAALCMPRPSTPDELRAELRKPYADVWVAREGEDAPIGAFAICWTFDDSELLIVATHPRARRRGFARAILEEAIAAAKGRGARAMVLEVRPSNDPARALYESLGFVEDGRRPRYYADGEDALQMVLSLE